MIAQLHGNIFFLFCNLDVIKIFPLTALYFSIGVVMGLYFYVLVNAINST